MSIESEQPWIRRLLDVGRALMTELDPQTVLDRVLETAQEITGARYAALGILNEDRTELERFLTLGVDDETHRAIGDLPRGRGVLGVLIEEPGRCDCRTLRAPLELWISGRAPRDAQLPRRAGADQRARPGATCT